ELFPNRQLKSAYLQEIESLFLNFVNNTGLFVGAVVPESAEYLFQELMRGEEFTISHPAAELVNAFNAFLKKERYGERFASARKTVECDFASTWHLLNDWLQAFVSASGKPEFQNHVDEAACLLMRGSFGSRQVIRASLETEIEGLLGNHALIQSGKYQFDLLAFTAKLKQFERDSVPQFQKYEALKHKLLHAKTEEMRL